MMLPAFLLLLLPSGVAFPQSWPVGGTTRFARASFRPVEVRESEWSR